MNVSELIEKLKGVPGHLKVCVLAGDDCEYDYMDLVSPPNVKFVWHGLDPVEVCVIGDET